MPITNQDFSNIIRHCRKKSGLSQLELATLAGVGKTSVFDIEKGKESVQLNTLLKIINTLNIHVTLETPFQSKDDLA